MRMVREEPDDLYSGYGREDVAPDLDTEGLQYDEGFQVSPREGIVVTGGLRTMKDSRSVLERVYWSQRGGECYPFYPEN